MQKLGDVGVGRVRGILGHEGVRLRGGMGGGMGCGQMDKGTGPTRIEWVQARLLDDI